MLQYTSPPTGASTPKSGPVRYQDVFPEWLPISDEAKRAAEDVHIPEDTPEHGFRDAALWWTEAGYKVLRETPRDTRNKRGQIDDQAGKKPRFGGNQYEQGTRDPQTIRQWWSGGNKLCNPGIVTQAAGVLVVDIDPRVGGSKNFAELCNQIGVDTRDVPRDTSPSLDRGVHLYWKLPAGHQPIKTSRPLLTGVDIPWHVPVAPSQRWVKIGENYKGPVNDFRSYRWIAGDPRNLPEAPEALLEAIGNLGGIKGVAPNPNAYTGELGRMVATTISCEAGDLKELLRTGIPCGKQNPVILALSTSMARRGVDMEKAIEVLLLILDNSPQDPDKPRWTREDLYGVGNPKDSYFQPGITYRQYQFISGEKAAQDAYFIQLGTEFNNFFYKNGN